MIIRALTTSILLSATCLTCLAQEPAADHPGGNSASVVTQGRPMPKFPAGLDGATINPKVPGAESDIACAPPMHGHDPRIMHMLERSGVVLSDDQVEQMTSLRRDLLKTVMPKKDHILLLAGDLKETLGAPTINDDQARKIFADIKLDIDAAYAKLVDHVIAVSHVFTADQRHKLKVSVDRWSLGPLGRPADRPERPDAPPPNPPGPPGKASLPDDSRN